MKILLALDPGLNRSGLAIFEDGVLAYSVPIEVDKDEEVLVRCTRIAREVLKQMSRYTYHECEHLTFVGEWPKVYHAEKNVKGANPASLIPLAAILGAVGAQLSLMYDATQVSYLPKEWTGTVKKFETVKLAKKSPRALKIERRLSPRELEVWASVKYHDVVDAIGIGLHHLGRLKRQRVFPRS